MPGLIIIYYIILRYVTLRYVTLCYVMLRYVTLCINFITDQNSEEHIWSCLHKEKLKTKVYNAVML